MISVQNISKDYGSFRALHNLSFDVTAGEVLGLLGPNGAGKSTTVKILCGLLPDYRGEVIIKGLNLKTDTIQIKRLLGYVPELAELYEVLTPAEFL